MKFFLVIKWINLSNFQIMSLVLLPWEAVHTGIQPHTCITNLAHWTSINEVLKTKSTTDADIHGIAQAQAGKVLHCGFMTPKARDNSVHWGTFLLTTINRQTETSLNNTPNLNSCQVVWAVPVVFMTQLMMIRRLRLRGQVLISRIRWQQLRCF